MITFLADSAAAMSVSLATLRLRDNPHTVIIEIQYGSHTGTRPNIEDIP